MYVERPSHKAFVDHLHVCIQQLKVVRCHAAVRRLGTLLTTKISSTSRVQLGQGPRIVGEWEL